jgi:hypothetical protein
MKRIVLSLCLMFVFSCAANGGPSAEIKKFDDEYRKALAALSPEQRSLLESPILEHAGEIERSRKEAAHEEEEYARKVPYATDEVKKYMTADLNRNIEFSATHLVFMMVRSEELARNLGYLKWLPTGTPLIEVFSLSTDEIKQQGLSTPTLYRTGPQRSFTLQSLDPVQHIRVEIEIRPSLENTRMALLSPGEDETSATEWHICERPYGDACVARSEGTTDSFTKFAGSNVLIQVAGKTKDVERVAAWLDKTLREQIAASGKAGDEVPNRHLALKGKVELTREGAAPAKVATPLRDEDVLVIEEPKLLDNLGAVVPDGTQSVTVRIRVLDPRVTHVNVDNGVETKHLQPVNGQVSATFPLEGGAIHIVAQAHMEPQGNFHGILGVQSIDVRTESNRRDYGKWLHGLLGTDPSEKK